RMNLMAASATVGGGRRVEDPELIQRFLSGHDFPCAQCGYNLRGLPAGACPECHEPIVIHIAGADLFKPVIWLARLSIAACVLLTIHGTIGLLRLVQVWVSMAVSMPPWGWGPGGGLKYQIATMLPPAISAVSFITLIVIVAG